MHPLLQTARQALVTGLLWGSVSLGVTSLFYFLLGATMAESALLVIPPMGVEFFICISTWYTCRMTVEYAWNPLKILTTHGTALVLTNGLWLFLIWLYTEALDLVFKQQFRTGLFTEAFPLFLAVGSFLYLVSVMGHYLLLAMEKNRRAEQEILQQKVLAGQAELKALKTTVHPHFLFNSLNLLGPLMETSPESAQQVVSQLTDFLLYSLRYGKQEWVSVGDELEHITNYLAIEKARLGERLTLIFDTEEKALEADMLSLTLLPLAENAIKHGIGQCLDGGSLRVSIKKINGLIRVTMINPYDTPARKPRGEGLGLQTLQRRFNVHYGQEGHVAIARKPDTFQVTLSFPAEKPGASGGPPGAPMRGAPRGGAPWTPYMQGFG